MEFNALYPELLVANLDQSTHFYVETLGFKVLFSRPEERFLFLSFHKSQLMLLEDNNNKHSRTGSLEYPRGRGINFSIETTDVTMLKTRLTENGYTLRIPIRDQWHRQNDIENGETQLWVMDPDGYLLRFIQRLGSRSVCETT